MSTTKTDSDGNSYIDLTAYVPAFIADMADFSELYKAAGYQEQTLREAMETLENQLYISTATDALTLWAKIYGASGLTQDELRASILARIRARQTCTPALIVQYAEDYTGEEVLIEEDFANYSFTITFVGCLGVPDNMEEFLKWLALIVPAHLTYEVVYTYNSWDTDVVSTWGDAAAYTWGSIRYAI